MVDRLTTALAEIGGCYLAWLVRTQGRSSAWPLPAAASLAAFTWLLTLHPTAAGRTDAACLHRRRTGLASPTAFFGAAPHRRSLDRMLDEIRELLRFMDAPQAECGAVNVLLDEHIGHVVARIRVLRQLERELKALRARCDGAANAAHCGILDGLAQPAPSRHAPAAQPHRRRAGVHPARPASSPRRPRT